MRSISIIFMLLIAISAHATFLKQNLAAKTVMIADDSNNLQLQIDYSRGCKISQVNIKGKNTISPLGVYTSIKTKTNLFTKVQAKKNRLEGSNIVFEDDKMSVTGTWIFTHSDNQILWDIRRQYIQNGKLDNLTMPAWNFSNIPIWNGGILNKEVIQIF